MEKVQCFKAIFAEKKGLGKPIHGLYNFRQTKFKEDSRKRKWKHMFVQCTLSILATGKYLIYSDITSWKNMAAAVVCLHCLRSKY